MFSDLGKIFLQMPRQAEKSDTRLDIKRHDPDQERRKKNEGDSNAEDPFGGEDYAIVSIEALHLFLIKFLQEQISAAQPEQKNFKTLTDTPSSPVSPRASKAANAYAAGAKTAPISISPSWEEPATPAEIDNAVPSISADETRIIHALLAELKILREKNIDVLRIERSDTFLNSLSAAVNKLKS